MTFEQLVKDLGTKTNQNMTALFENPDPVDIYILPKKTCPKGERRVIYCWNGLSKGQAFPDNFNSNKELEVTIERMAFMLAHSFKAAEEKRIKEKEQKPDGQE